MSQFHVVNESSEDTLEATDNLQDAIRVAREAAIQGQAGDLVSVLESGGKAVRQFARLPDGSVVEQAIARQDTNRSETEADLPPGGWSAA